MSVFRKINNPLITNAAKMVSSNIVMYLLPFIVTPILSRIYEPTMFGEWGIFSSLFQIINVVLFLCYEYTIVKVTNKEFSLACSLSLVVSTIIILLVVIIFFVGYAIEIPFIINFPSKIFFLSILVISALTVILQNIANREQRYWVVSISSIILGVAQAFCRICFGFFSIFPNGLIAGTTIAQLFCLIFLFIYVGKSFFRGILTNNSIRDIFSFAVKYKKFPLYDAPAVLLTFLTFNLSLIILSTFYSKAEIGCLSIIHQMLLLPISLVGGALAKVYYQQISNRFRNEDLIIIDTSRKMLRIVLLLSVLPTLFLGLGGDFLLCLFLGSKWNNAGAIAICMAIWSIPNILTQPLLPIYRHYDKQNYMLYYNILIFGFSVGSLLISCNLGVNIYKALLIYSWFSALFSYFMFISIVKLTKVKLRDITNPLVVLLHTITIALLIFRSYSLL